MPLVFSGSRMPTIGLLPLSSIVVVIQGSWVWDHGLGWFSGTWKAGTFLSFLGVPQNWVPVKVLPLKLFVVDIIIKMVAIVALMFGGLKKNWWAAAFETRQIFNFSMESDINEVFWPLKENLIKLPKGISDKWSTANFCFSELTSANQYYFCYSCFSSERKLIVWMTKARLPYLLY